MKFWRRKLLGMGAGAGVLALSGVTRLFAAASAGTDRRNGAAFLTSSLSDTLRALGAEGASESGDIRFLAATPDVAENGDVVPVAVESAIPGTRSIALMVEKNPTTLAGSFDISEGTEAFVSTRLKMVETSIVIALVRANGRHYYARKEVKVTQCGCGA